MKTSALWILFLATSLLALPACKGSQEGNDSKSTQSNEGNPAATGSDSDRLVFHTGVCFGACPDYCMSVDRSGHVEMWGGRFAQLSGFYTAQASPQAIQTVEALLASSDWDTLQSEYRVGWTDDRAVELIRVIDGRMVHSMYDYGAQVKGLPAQAYELIEMLYQSGGFKAMAPDLFTCWRFQPTNFNVEGVTYPLTKAEGFFLWQEWRKVAPANIKTTLTGPFVEAEEPFYAFGKNKIMNQDPVARYPNCLGDAPTTKKVYSNGQIFTFQYEDGGQTKIDMGYPFFEENKFAFDAADNSK